MSDELNPEIFFVVSAPISGGKVLFDFLTAPKETAWIPEKLMKHPSRLSIARSANKLNWPFLGEFFLERRSYWKSVPEPGTGDAFWHHYIKEFVPDYSKPLLPGPEQVTAEEAGNVKEAVKDICYAQHRLTFAAQIEGLPRIRMLRAVFPKAKFIQVLRDPRSVAYHIFKRKHAEDYPLWIHREKWIELMPEPLQSRLKELPESPLNFYGVYTRFLHELYRQEMSELPESDQLEVAYSDLLSKPEKTLEKVMQFTDLPVTKRFDYFVKFHSIQRSNKRTSRKITTEESDQLAQAVEKF